VSALNVSKAYTLLNRYRTSNIYCKEAIITCLCNIKQSEKNQEGDQNKLTLISLLKEAYFQYGVNHEQIAAYNDALKHYSTCLELTCITNSDINKKNELVRIIDGIKSRIEALSINNRKSMSLSINESNCSTPSQQMVIKTYSQKLPTIVISRNRRIFSLKSADGSLEHMHSKESTKNPTIKIVSSKPCITCLKKAQNHVANKALFKAYLQNKNKALGIRVNSLKRFKIEVGTAKIYW
jgi:hypothetical protein